MPATKAISVSESTVGKLLPASLAFMPSCGQVSFLMTASPFLYLPLLNFPFFCNFFSFLRTFVGESSLLEEDKESVVVVVESDSEEKEETLLFFFFSYFLGFDFKMVLRILAIFSESDWISSSVEDNWIFLISFLVLSLCIFEGLAGRP